MSVNKNKKNLKHKRKRQSWPITLLLGAGLLLLGVAAFVFARPPQTKTVIEVSGTPSLKVDREKVDLGNVKLGQTVKVTFKLTNVGDQTLEFNKAPYVEVLEGC